MKKAIKISLLIFIISGLIAVILTSSLLIGSYFKYRNLELVPDTLDSPALTIAIYDSDNKPIKEYNHFTTKYVHYEALPSHVKDAFISIEDKTFYNHSGVNYKRIVKAGVENLKSFNLKQGASTISQQLIKNTHLSSEKTFNRKIKEIILTKKLESRYSKDEILEKYLNIIYFGNNCYGIESAANYYFSKQAKELEIHEAATLAGLIRSPRNYSPVLAPEKSLKRRNLVISEMQKDDLITEDSASHAKARPLSLNINAEGENKLNSYSEAALDEAISILKMPAKQIAIGEYKIYTYQRGEAQAALKSSLTHERFLDNDYAGIIIDPQSSQIIAYLGDSNYKILEAKRSPGSTIKPVLVYAPAINENIISPATQLLDEEIDINGYSPKNVTGTFSGHVSARDALAKSINIPAIKVLSYTGIDKSKAYAERMGLEFDENDNNYSIALGGLTNGFNLKELTNSYSTLANGGKYSDAKFISYIQNKDGKIIYKHDDHKKTVLREDAAYLVTDMLKTCTKEGTARKLSDLPFEVASKTGTVGKPDSSENLDAYNISYTPNLVVGVWTGNLNNKGMAMAGGNQPTAAVKEILSKVVSSNAEFTPPSGIREIEIDITELEGNHQVIKASAYVPERYRKAEIFSYFNLPKENFASAVKLIPATLKGEETENGITLEFEASEFLEYYLYKDEKGNEKLLKDYISAKGSQVYVDKNVIDKNQYILVTKFKNYTTGEESIGDKSRLTIIKSEDLTPATAKAAKKWYL